MLRNLLLLCLGITLCNARLDAQELISWHDDLNEARQISQQYKVPILLHFYGDNCMPCKALEKNVFARPEVASTMQRYFVPVHINATQDRRTAAQFGVHSWPTDVFLSPDGKVLSQGVCNPSAAAYLQNLQSVAVMNRDRNLMLAGQTPPGSQPSNQTTNPAMHSASTSAATGAQPGNPYAAPQASNMQSGPAGNSWSGQPQAQAPYGRLATTSLQQEAPGREQAPAPYTNPSSGASPYAPGAPASGLAAVGQSALPSPTLSGQSAHGQATDGLVGAGPLANTPSMNVPPATPGTSAAYKDANIPQSSQWSGSSGQVPTGAVAATVVAGSALGSGLPASPAVATTPGLATAAQLPVSGKASPAQSSVFAAKSSPAGAASGALVENPHFGQHAQTDASQPASRTAAQPMFHNNASTTSNATARGPIEKVTSVAEPKEPASVPALSGYCPVALLTTSQWVEGNPQYAIRHRGRVYFLSSQEAADKFLAAPDDYCPVLSGYDPLVLLRDGRLVEGSVYTGLKDATQNRIMLFSSAENKKFFQENYDRLANDLDQMLKPAAPLTAQAPTSTLSR